MCGRYNFTVEEAEELKKIVQRINEQLKQENTIKTGEIYPTNLVPIVTKVEPHAMTWGFPHWQNSGVIINAKSETVLDKKMFRESVLERRCLVPSTGFYEWHKHSDGSKTKYLFKQPGEPILWMAGIWNTYRDKTGEEKRQFVILTTAANESMKAENDQLTLLPNGEGELFHDRMPVIIQREEQEAWLSKNPGLHHIFQREHIWLNKMAV